MFNHWLVFHFSIDMISRFCTRVDIYIVLVLCFHFVRWSNVCVWRWQEANARWSQGCASVLSEGPPRRCHWPRQVDESAPSRCRRYSRHAWRGNEMLVAATDCILHQFNFYNWLFINKNTNFFEFLDFVNFLFNTNSVVWWIWKVLYLAFD